ncbi:hypothetical protein GH733_013311, partial [Mirounga leonina]
MCVEVMDHDSAGGLLAKHSLERTAMKNIRQMEEMRPTVSSHLSLCTALTSITDAEAQKTLNHKMAKRQSFRNEQKIEAEDLSPCCLPIDQINGTCSDYDLEFGTECLQLALKYGHINAKLVEGSPDLWKHVKVTSGALCPASRDLEQIILEQCYNYVCVNVMSSDFEETRKLLNMLEEKRPVSAFGSDIGCVIIKTQIDCFLVCATLISALVEAGYAYHGGVNDEQRLQASLRQGVTIIATLIKERNSGLVGMIKSMNDLIQNCDGEKSLFSPIPTSTKQGWKVGLKNRAPLVWQGNRMRLTLQYLTTSITWISTHHKRLVGGRVSLKRLPRMACRRINRKPHCSSDLKKSQPRAGRDDKVMFSLTIENQPPP